jgi:hypothetical protein
MAEGSNIDVVAVIPEVTQALNLLSETMLDEIERADTLEMDTISITLRDAVERERVLVDSVGRLTMIGTALAQIERERILARS